jgi:hypothetical protein
MAVIASVTDPDGRRVDLTDERWAHIIRPDGHPDLETLQDQVLEAVAHPDLHLTGRKANEEWFLVAEVGPSRWVQVVVAFGAERGWIVTAFPRRKQP